MPIYGYRCVVCGHEFECWQRMSDPPEADCPSCGGSGRRLFYPAGIVFKGSGFYKTDSRKAPSDGASASTESKPSGEASTASTSATGGE